MRWLVVVLVLLVPSVTFADEASSSQHVQVELGGSLSVGGLDGVGVPDGVRAGVLYQPWAHLGVQLDAFHFFQDPHQYDKGLHSFDSATLAVRVSGAIGPVTLFFAPGAGFARGIERDGDVYLTDRVNVRPAFSLRTGLELAIAKRFLVGAAAYAITSPLTDALESSAGVDFYAGFRF